MNSFKTLAGIFTILLAFNLIFAEDFSGNQFEITENLESFDSLVAEGDIDKTWGAINNDSVRVGIPFGYSMTLSIGSIAAWNITFLAPRTMDGIRLRSFNNTGAFGDLIEGGVGYTFATFQLIGHAHHFYFLVEAFENYTSSLITTTGSPTTTTPNPDIIFKQWGVINYASKQLDGRHGFTQWNNPGEISVVTGRVNATRTIDGLRLSSRNGTLTSAEILEGGIGFNYFRFRVVGVREFVDIYFNMFENGTYLQTRERVYGTVNATKLDERRIQNYPPLGGVATGNATFTTSKTIQGIRITFLNYTDGLYVITNGGLNTSSVSFDFTGPYPGEPYDFNIEIFGNSAITTKISLTLLSMLILFFNLLR